MREPRILHIAQDEKFINGAYFLFEQAFPGENKFVILKPSANPPIKYLNDKVQVNAHFEVKSADIVEKLLELSTQYEVVVFHGLNKVKGAVFLRSPEKNKFMTIVYGAEIYNSGIIGETLFGPETKELNKKIEKRTLVEILKDIYRSVAYVNHRPDLGDVDIRKVLYKMNVFGSFPSSSYQRYIDGGVYNPTVKKVPFTYYPLEFIIRDKDVVSRGKDILLGNSASATNNHLEALNMLKNHDLNGRQIYAPLSYGKKRYAREIEKYGNDLFPIKFNALTTFLPLEEYNKILSRCGVVIMNHYRPQAMGNIIASLYMGSKVFLNETDAYRYFKRMGCHVYSIEKDMKAGSNPFQLLSEEKIAENRHILNQELSTGHLVDKMRAAFSEIFNFSLNKRGVIS